MAEKFVMNESYIYSQTASPSEMTPLVSPSDGDLKRIQSVASVLSWEKVGSDDDVDHEVSTCANAEKLVKLLSLLLCRSLPSLHQ